MVANVRTLGTAAGTGTADYISKIGSQLTIAEGQTSGTITIAILEDLLAEPDEDFFVTISSILEETDAVGRAEIEDDQDAPINTPTISIDDHEVLESEGSVTFRLYLSEPTDHDVTVEWETENSPLSPAALAGYDYQAAGGTATIPAGYDYVDLPAITIVNDALDEFHEQFRVKLSNPSGATLGEEYGITTIYDDDDPPLVSIADVMVVEGDPGDDVKATFEIILSAPSGKPIQLVARTGPGFAMAGSDYVHKQSTISFPLNATTGASQVTIREFAVNIVEDLVMETSPIGLYEYFVVNLTNLVNAGYYVASALGVIEDDDNRLELTIYNGQFATQPISDFLEEGGPTDYGRGAFTVANLNDTDADGMLDVFDSVVLGSFSGRDEVDLMRLDLKKPNNMQSGTSATLSVTGAVLVWQYHTKQAGIPLVSQWSAEDFDSAGGTITVWLEALEPSETLRDISATLSYANHIPDKVNATAVWADITDFKHDHSDAVIDPSWSDLEPDSDAVLTYLDATSYATIDDDPHFGLTPIGSDNGFWYTNHGVGVQATVWPLGVEHEDVVLWDFTRRAELRSWRLDGGTWTTAELREFPLLEENVNDDESSFDEVSDPTDDRHLYQLDAPGVVFQDPVFTGYRYLANFEEFVRVTFLDSNSGTPTNGVWGSRASTIFDWHFSQYLSAVGGWHRTTGDDPEVDGVNDIGPGHRTIPESFP